MVAPVRSALLLSGLLAALLLSGCSASNGPEGQSASAAGSLTYNGASPGTHTANFQCDGSGSVHVSANLGSGSLHVRVTDGSGKSVFDRTVQSPGQDASSDPVSGTAGGWTLTVTRSNAVSQYNPYPSFSGQYAIHVDC